MIFGMLAIACLILTAASAWFAIGAVVFTVLALLSKTPRY